MIEFERSVICLKLDGIPPELERIRLHQFREKVDPLQTMLEEEVGCVSNFCRFAKFGAKIFGKMAKLLN
jgi:hypothetical protein